MRTRTHVSRERPQQHTKSIEIDDDPVFQRKVWRFERVGWVIMALVVFFGLLGLFSGGPLARSEAASADGAFRVRYERFIRAHAANVIHIDLGGGLVGDTVAIRLSREFLERFQVEQIRPEPARSAAAAEGILLSFELGKGEGMRTISIGLRATGPALLLRSQIAWDGRSSAELVQLIYP
jgi:hypothetical protein